MVLYQQNSLRPLVNFFSLNMSFQVFTNCVHGYDRAPNVHASSVARARKFVLFIFVKLI